MTALFSPSPATPSSPITHSSRNITNTYTVTAHADNSVALWKRSATSWDLVATVPPQKSTITDISFSSDTNANTFAISKADGTATIYEFTIANKTTISTTTSVRDADTLSAIAFSDTGLLATLGGGVLRIYGKKWALLAEMDVEAVDLAFAPGGKALIAGGTIFRCTGEDFEWCLFTTIEDTHDIRSVDWGRDGLIGIARQVSVEIWELRRGEPERIAHFEEQLVRSVKWDPMGAALVSVHSDGETKTWARHGASLEWGLTDPLQPHVDAMVHC